MLIGFVTGGLPFNGNSLNEKSLGGSETALLSLARALGKQGHKVQVFCNCDKPGIYDEVHYYRQEQFQHQILTTPYDVLVVSRWMEFLSFPSSAGLRVLWLHDTITDENRLMGNLWQTDLVIGLSQYHIDNYCQKVPLQDWFWKSSNGVDMELVQNNLRPKIEKKLIYTSRPERGLHFLLTKIMPRLWERDPELTIHYANYDLGNMQVPEHVTQINQLCDSLARQNPNIVALGNLTKEQLYRHISSSQMLLYPTDFPEISCITAMEAQACGTPVITTNNFALMETVGMGRLVEGVPQMDEYCDNFADTVWELLQNPTELQMLQDAAPKVIADRGYTWDDIARNWVHKFQSMMEERWINNKEAIVKTLIRQNDLAMAKIISKKNNLEIEAEVDKRIEEFEERPYPFTSKEDVTKGYEDAKRRFQMVQVLANNSGVHPASVLDFASGVVSFALFAKKMWPEAEVEAVDTDEDVIRHIANYAEKNNLQIGVYQEVDKNKKYDLVFLGDFLDDLADPVHFLNNVVNPWLSENGKIAFTVRSGANNQVYKNVENNRLWNFNFNDFEVMFEGAQGFNATFVDEKMDGDLQGHWVVLTEKVEKYNQIPTKRRCLTTRPYVSLALCMITKNEESNLFGALNSIKDYVDNIYIADCESNDKTLWIAEQAGAKTEQIDFQNFSEARNISKAKAKEDWILWIDSDERVINPHKLRSYLGNSPFNGFSIRQNHLMLDLHGTFDIPVRCFRNRPHYQFTGCIHEHCEDLSKAEFDQNIEPTMLIQNVDLAHYGYVNEKQRRKKCSNRNMNYLIQDVIKNGDKRQLTWVLVIRDYLNIIKWRMEKRQSPPQIGTFDHELLDAVITTFYHKFTPKSKHFALVEPMVQEAMMLRGIGALPYGPLESPPFEVVLALAGGVAGIKDEKVRNMQPRPRWFIDADDFKVFMSARANSMMHLLEMDKYLHQTPPEPEVPFYVPPYLMEMPDTVKLLSAGDNIMPEL